MVPELTKRAPAYDAKVQLIFVRILPCPSAMLELMLREHLIIWSVSLNLSSAGNLCTSSKISFFNCLAIIHKSKSVKSLCGLSRSISSSIAHKSNSPNQPNQPNQPVIYMFSPPQILNVCPVI